MTRAATARRISDIVSRAMPRNVEIKARIGDVAAMTVRVAAIATDGPQEIVQDDTFFACTNGRLKLRAFSHDDGQLIFYRRADAAGPKESFFVLTPTTSPDSLRDTLAHACGATGRVRKRRTLYLVGRTRVHLDQVEGLGDFLELEVVLRHDEAPGDGVAEAHGLLDRLGIARTALVERAYVDLLREAR